MFLWLGSSEQCDLKSVVLRIEKTIEILIWQKRFPYNTENALHKRKGCICGYLRLFEDFIYEYKILTCNNAVAWHFLYNFVKKNYPILCHVIISFKEPININSFSSISYWSNSEYWAQKQVQSGNFNSTILDVHVGCQSSQKK